MRINTLSIHPGVYKLTPVLIPFFFSCNPSPKDDTESQEEETTQKTNIIYIMADDLGYGDLGCYGQEHIKTPNLDKMANEGIKFTNHYCGSPVSAPSRSVLMTGLHAGHTYVRGNKQAEPHGQLPIPDETLTVGEAMKEAGYTTGMIGKWGLGIEGSSGAPSNQGWDLFYGYTDQVLAHNYYPEYLIRNGEKEYLDNKVKYLDSTAWHKGLGSYSIEKNEYSHDLFTKEALQFIEHNKDTSFFLYIPYTIPHNNGEAPDGEKQEVPDYGIYKDKDWESDYKGYAAMISRMDKDIGTIMEKLKALNIAENTLVIFTSDNGPMKGKHGFTKFFDSNGPLRGAKRDLYEGGIRVPLIAWWPKNIPAATTSDHLSGFWDFMATACDVAGVEPPENTDGISYLPALLGKQQPKHDYLYWEFYTWDFTLQAVRLDNWKAIKFLADENNEEKFELYDLGTDLAESNNVADKYPDVVAKIDSIMHAAHTPSEHFKFPEEK